MYGPARAEGDLQPRGATQHLDFAAVVVHFYARGAMVGMALAVYDETNANIEWFSAKYLWIHIAARSV